jgi:hypothetical protein
VVVEMLFQVLQVIGVAHPVMVDEVVMVVEVRLEDVVGQMRFDVVRMQDGPGRDVVVVVVMGRHRRRSRRGRRRRRCRRRGVFLVETSVTPAAEEGDGRDDDDDQGRDEGNDDDLRQTPAQQMRLFQLEKVATD